MNITTFQWGFYLNEMFKTTQWKNDCKINSKTVHDTFRLCHKQLSTSGNDTMKKYNASKWSV